MVNEFDQIDQGLADMELSNLIAGPEMGASVKPQQTSLARELILKYKAGTDPVKDQIAAEEDKAPNTANNPITSRDWSNRAAKQEAKKYLINPTASFSNVTFGEIWGNVLRAEGGYVNNPADPGGETKFGISKRSYPNENISAMTADRAQEIFKTDFYDAVGGDTLMKINPGLAAHVSDMAFNAGPKAAIKLLYDAAQLPRQNQITPELLDRLNDSENLVKDYTVARLKYYSSLGNAPTFIKGWVNRVNNLNKALKVKSGLNGAYKAARNLDVQTLVQHIYSAQDQLAPKFRELDQIEIERLQRANEMLAPGYRRPTAIKKETSSLGEVFKATYDAKYYTNTIDGMNELALRSAREASDANRKALGDKFDPSLVEKLTFGLYGGIQSIEDWQNEVNKFKAEHPEVKLPFDSAAQVYALSQKKAQDIEARYNALDSGSFKDGAAASLNKLGHVIAGYLPGEVLGSMSDRLEGAVNLLPIPGATSAVNVAKGVAAVMAGTGAAQTVVQPKRQELGLEGGLTQGLENTAMAGLGQAVVGSLVNIATKLWRSGSQETAREIFKETERMKKQLKADIPDAQTQQLERAVASVEDQAKMLERNPFGDDYSAKMKFEEMNAAAMEDVLAGRPVRNFDSPPVRVLDNSDKLKSQMSSMIDDPEILKASHSAVDEWTAFKKANIAQDPVFPATVPVELNGQLPRFKTKEELEAFLITSGKSLTDEHFIVKEQALDGTWYPARAAELENIANPTTRFDEGSTTIGDVRGFEGSEDVAIAQKYPDLVKIREVADLPQQAPAYVEGEDVLGRSQYLADLDVYGRTKLTNLDRRYEASMNELKRFDPNTVVDLGDEVATGQSIKELSDELTEERSALSEMFSCMVGGETAKGV